MDDDRFAHLQHDDWDEKAAYIHQIAEFFRTYDAELRGFLSQHQFSPLYESLVEAGSVESPIEEVMRELDPDDEGIVKLNDFVRWYAQADVEEGSFEADEFQKAVMGGA